MFVEWRRGTGSMNAGSRSSPVGDGVCAAGTDGSSPWEGARSELCQRQRPATCETGRCHRTTCRATTFPCLVQQLHSPGPAPGRVGNSRPQRFHQRVDWPQLHPADPGSHHRSTRLCTSAAIQRGPRTLRDQRLRRQWSFFVGDPSGKIRFGRVPRQVPAATIPAPLPDGSTGETTSRAIPILGEPARGPAPLASSAGFSSKSRLRHSVDTFIVGSGNQLAYNTALYVAEFSRRNTTRCLFTEIAAWAKLTFFRDSARNSSPTIPPNAGCI